MRLRSGACGRPFPPPLPASGPSRWQRVGRRSARIHPADRGLGSLEIGQRVQVDTSREPELEDLLVEVREAFDRCRARAARDTDLARRGGPP
ncbi:MAG TPA: hypothetical protein VFV95_16340 [Vicinamibacterales bacterium]|nr:hypothetical protein [Vicinamibacterales bacterium]